ncbi:MAG: ABC-ATPase domain-containing protein [Thermodesulfobacteriota bacterium]
MAHSEQLRRTLHRIDQRGYKAYQDLKGHYDFPGYSLVVDHVQGDPFASPSRMRILVAWEKANFDRWLLANRSRQVAFRDFLTRAFHRAIVRYSKGSRGIGHSGRIGVDVPGQEILDRSSVLVSPDGIEVRFVMGLPAHGRTVLGREAEEMFFQELPRIVEASLMSQNLDKAALRAHVACSEDQDSMRGQLQDRGLVAFLADGSVLPRRSGVDDRPMIGKAQELPVISFCSPPTMAVTLQRPNGGPVQGMGIPAGITLVVGGGFHGKSTLLRAIERSVYNHVPGDGREAVVTDPSAIKIRAEDGRYVEKVNISPFIQNLPFGKDTRSFSTDNASGSTSQAANIIEALEVGTKLILMDEDTCATNFMIRDERMQALVSKDREPITPFLDKVRQLYQELGVSTILVMGGSGDYFDVADRVILMDHYRPLDVTGEVSLIRQRLVSRRHSEGGGSFGELTPRAPFGESFQAQKGRKEVNVDANGLNQILYGTTSIDLEKVEQIVDPSQTRAIAQLMRYYSTRYADGRTPLRSGLEKVMEDLDRRGFNILGSNKAGNLALPRIQELAAAINRMRTLRVRQT